MDPALIRRAQGGDLESFETLISGRIGPMTRLAMAILGHEADARDAVAESLIAIWRELPRLPCGAICHVVVRGAGDGLAVVPTG